MSDDPYVAIAIPEELANRLERATGEVPYLLNSAARVFDWLHTAHAAGYLDADTGWSHVLELCARGLDAAVHTEAVAINDFDTILRAAIGTRARADLAGQPIYNGGKTYDPEQ